MTVPKEIPVELTESDLVNMLSYAGYGISYWAKSYTVNKMGKTYRVVVRDFMRELDPGKTEPTESVLTFDALTAAFSTLVTTDKLPRRTEEHDDLGFYAEVADRTIQQAMFGKRYVG